MWCPQGTPRGPCMSCPCSGKYTCSCCGLRVLPRLGAQGHFAAVQRKKMWLLDSCVLQGEVKRAGLGNGEQGCIHAGRDVYENRFLIISLSLLFSTRSS